MKSFKEYISERISDAEKTDLESRKERMKRDTKRRRDELKKREKQYKDSPI